MSENELNRQGKLGSYSTCPTSKYTCQASGILHPLVQSEGRGNHKAIGFLIGMSQQSHLFPK